MSSTSEPPPGTTGAPQLLTVEEAAACLGVTRDWLLETARMRRIRCVRFGRRIRFRVEHLQEFLEDHEEPVYAPSRRRMTSVPPRSAGGARSRI